MSLVKFIVITELSSHFYNLKRENATCRTFLKKRKQQEKPVLELMQREVRRGAKVKNLVRVMIRFFFTNSEKGHGARMVNAACDGTGTVQDCTFTV